MTNTVDVTFRNVDKKILQNFKAEAVREDKTFGQALVEAFILWLQREKSLAKKKSKLSDCEPVDFGLNTENLSTHIDDLVYG
jgi:hypothetical protein